MFSISMAKHDHRHTIRHTQRDKSGPNVYCGTNGMVSQLSEEVGYIDIIDFHTEDGEKTANVQQ